MNYNIMDVFLTINKIMNIFPIITFVFFYMLFCFTMLYFNIINEDLLKEMNSYYHCLL